MENNNYIQKNLRDLVFDFESELGAINSRRETFNDMSEVLGHIRIKMDNIRDEEVRVYFYMELHTKIRLIEELLHYTVRDLNKDYRNTYEIMNAMFEKIVKKESEPSTLE